MRYTIQPSFHTGLLRKCIIGLMLTGGMTAAGGIWLKPMPTTLAQAVESSMPAAAESIGSVIAITSAEDGVQKFSAAHQLYMKGEPLDLAQVERLQTLLQEHPNIYVILIDTTSDVVGDDSTLSRGIGNSAAFQSIQNPELNERSGVLFMVYFDSDQGRQIYMRAEALPDRLGVGEANFADSSGNPRELLRLFVNAVRNEGKDVPGALEVVIQRINGTIQDHVQGTVQGVAQTVQQTETGLTEFASRFKVFQARQDVEGPLGSPAIETWQQQLDQAKAALAERQFEEATSLTSKILEQIQTHTEAMNAYEQTPAIAADVAQMIDSLPPALDTLAANEQTQVANELATQAQQSLATYESRYQAGRLDFKEPLVTAQQQAEGAIAAVTASRELTAQQRHTQYLLFALTVLGTVAMGLGTHFRAYRRRRRAQLELTEAKAEISGKAEALIDLMDQVNYSTLPEYAGKTDQMAQALVEHVTDALTLVGGAEKFLAEAESLIKGHYLTNTFRIVNYERAIALLTNPDTTLAFGLQDSVRTVMTQGSAADSWRQRLLEQDTSRRFEKSLRDVLLAMAEHRDRADQLLQEITTKDQKVAPYLTQIETEASALRPQVQAIQTQSQPVPTFRLEAAADALLPMILDSGGLIDRGRAIMAQDPVRACDEFGDTAHRMTQDAKAIVTVAQGAWQTLIPTLHHAHQALNAHGIATDWADQQQRELSDALEDITNRALRVAIAEPSQQTQQDIAALTAQIKLVVEQDQARREICPPLIAAAITDVTQARQTIHDTLKQAGVFAEGRPQQILREPQRDPSERIDMAQTSLEQLPTYLSQGDTAAAATYLTNITTLTQAAHDLVHATHEALAHYTDVLQERQQRTKAIRASISAAFQPTLERIQATYAAEVLALVAPEVDTGKTIANNIDLTHTLLQQAQTLSEAAQTQYQRAHLLTANDSLNEADQVLRGAQYQLDALTKAEAILQQHQQKAEADLVALTASVEALRTQAQAEYVRQTALQQVEKATQALAQTQTLVPQQPYHPYASMNCLTTVGKWRSKAVRNIEADREAYEAAQAALASASQMIKTAEANVHRAQTTSFAHAHVHTNRAEESLGRALKTFTEAQTDCRDRAYEKAQRGAKQAISLAKTTIEAANSAISQARREHDAKVSRLAREAEARRRAAIASSSSYSSSSGGGYSSGGSSGGGFGGGGSGSSGGGFGGGGSGSSGGGW